MAASPLAVHRIVATTDFSPASMAAVHYAGQWAQGLGASLLVVNFIQPQEQTVAAGFGPGVEIEALLESAGRGLRAIEADAALRGVAMATEVGQAAVVDGLAALVRAGRADLIVSASAGRRGLRKFLLGSTAEGIFRHATCPVLLLGPALAHAPAGPPRCILAATDFSPEATVALRHAAALAQAGPAALRLLHVLPASPPGEVEQREAEAMARLRQLAPAGAGGIPAQVEFGPAAATIVQVAEATAADLIVVGARPQPAAALYTGWAVAYQVLCHAPCPVLTVRAPSDRGRD